MSHLDNSELVIKSVFNKYASSGKISTLKEPAALQSTALQPAQELKLSKEQFSTMILDLSKHITELNGVQVPEIEAAYALFIDGGMSYQHFSMWWRSSHKFSYFTGEKGLLLRKAWTLYRKYALREGEIDQESFMKLLDDLHIKGSEDDFDKLDTDNDGLMDFREFTRWLNWF